MATASADLLDLIAEARAATCGEQGDRALLADTVTVAGRSGGLSSRFACEEVAVACVTAALLAADALGAVADARRRALSVNREHVSVAVRSERHFTSGGVPAGGSFAPLSRFWRTADGWVRTHANYPWHKNALLRATGTTGEPEEVSQAMAQSSSTDVEERVVEAGGICAAVRSPAEWDDHPQGRALGSEPLVSLEVAQGAAARSTSTGPLPAVGVRIIDLTRVIAGPVCTRYLGALGADVLRIDPPGHPDMPSGVAADTLAAKRSAFVDLDDDDGSSLLHSLLDEADVVVLGYRPGALDRFGLEPQQIMSDHPGIVVVALDAWGHSGPWAGRRGFDSIVQAACGIALCESPDGGTPGALPCQLLDHGTGYLAAAAALDGLRNQRDRGGTHLRRLSLARTAHWLSSTLQADRDVEEQPAIDPSPFLVELTTKVGAVSLVAPPGSLTGEALRWPSTMTLYGDDDPHWRR